MEYNRYIGISPPMDAHFDVRNFAENMKSVKLKVKPFRLGFYQLALLVAGDGRVSTDGNDLLLRDYTLFFNLPGQIVFWDVPQNWRGYYINLSEAFYTIALNGFPRLSDLPYFRNYTRPILLSDAGAYSFLELMAMLDKEYKSRSEYWLPIGKGLINSILAYALQAYDRASTDKLILAAKQSPAERFVTLVQDQLSAISLGLEHGSLQVGDLAKELYVSPQHLSSTVKELTGLSPNAYIIRGLIEEAQKLMRATDMSIAEIADQLGYEDPAYFSRVFKKETGITPTAFRTNS